MELKALEGAGPPSAVALVPMEKKSDRVKKANCVCLCTQASKRALRNKADASNGRGMQKGVPQGAVARGPHRGRVPPPEPAFVVSCLLGLQYLVRGAGFECNAAKERESERIAKTSASEARPACISSSLSLGCR